MKKNFFVLILVLLSLALQAQDNNLSGIVSDASSSPIVNATISIYRPSDTKPYAKTSTDGTGKFKIMIKVNDILQISHLGYLSFRTTLTGNTLPPIILKLDELNLGEIMVKGEKPLVEQQFDRTVVNVEGDSKAGINATDVLRKVPGLVVLNGNEIRFEGKGITVNIDDKPTRLSGVDLINLLNSTSTRNIAKLEVLYNPSAKYDAQGEGGILNIKTLKRTKPGYNGSLSLTGGHGWKYLTGNNASLSLNYRSNNDYFYMSHSVSKGQQYQEIKAYTRIAGIGQSLQDLGVYISPYTNQNTRLGYDHYFNKKNVFGILLTGYYNITNPSRESTTDIYSTFANTIDSTRISSNHSNRLSKGFNINLNYKLTLDSAKQQEITMDADGGLFSYRDDNFLTLRLNNPGGILIGDPYSLIQDGNTMTRILSYKADYSQKTKKATLESGLKVSNVKIENGFNSLRRNDVGNSFDNGSNDFDYKETIAAAYVSMKFDVAKLTIQPGLRAEQTFTHSYSPTIDSTIKRNYLSLFPNLAIGYKIKSHSLSATYSRRIGRPNYSYLNPFRIVRSAYSILQGNPYLSPSYTENFRLGYSYKAKYTFSVTYRNAQDVITDLSTVDDQSKVITDTKANLSENQNYGANLGYYNKFFKLWDLGVSFGFSNSHYRFPYQNQLVSIAQSSFTYSMDNRFTLKKSWWISAFLYGQTRVTYGNQINLPYSFLNLGAGKNILKGKGSLSLSINDIYYGSITRSETRYGNVNYDTYSKYDSRNVRLNFSYSFGNSQVKIRKRAAGSTEEQNRSN